MNVLLLLELLILFLILILLFFLWIATGRFCGQACGRRLAGGGGVLGGKQLQNPARQAKG